VLAIDRLESIATEENGFLAEEAPDARGVAGLAADMADIILDEERGDGADANDCARCAKAGHGQPASKTRNGRNCPQNRDIDATAMRKRVESMVGAARSFPQYRAIRRWRGLSL